MGVECKAGGSSVWPQWSLLKGMVSIGTICLILVPTRSLFLNFGPYSDDFLLQAMKVSTFEVYVLQLHIKFKCFIKSFVL